MSKFDMHSKVNAESLLYNLVHTVGDPNGKLQMLRSWAEQHIVRAAPAPTEKSEEGRKAEEIRQEG